MSEHATASRSDRPRTGLILDFGGVLTTDIAACTRAFDRRSGVPEGTFLSVVGRDPAGMALYADLERGAITQAEWNKGTAALLGTDPENLLGRVLADLRPQPEMVAAAQAARRAGVRVGIFSNSVGRRPFDPYAGFALETAFDAVLISEDHRARKPDAHLYRTMLDLMDLPADACVFVDDTAHNLPPAEVLGIATVHAHEPATTIKELERLLGVPLT